MRNFGLMDYQEYLKKQDKNNEKPINTSISFENFLKNKSFKEDNTQNHSISPKKPLDSLMKSLEKTPIPRTQDPEKATPLSDSLKKMRKLIDDGFKPPVNKEERTSEERPSCFY